MISCRVPISTKQAMFLKSRKRGNIFLGGIGSGKTRVICYRALTGALEKRRSAVVSFSYTNLRDVVTHTMFEALDAYGLQVYKDFVFHKVDNFFEIRGTQILMRSGDEPDRLRGINLDDFYLDEARQFPDRTIFDVLIGRIRNREDASWGIGSTTKGKNWLYDIIEAEGLTSAFESGFTESENMSVIVQSSYENPFLPKSYLSELSRLYSGAFKDQEMMAKIVDFSAGVFTRDWFQNRDFYYKPKIGVRYWDLAASTKTAADFSVGVLIAFKDGIYNVVDVIRKKATYPELRELIVQTAISDGVGVTIGVEQVGMQCVVAQDLSVDKRLAGYVIKPHRPEGDKLTRALPLTSRFKMQTLRLCAGAWNEPYIDEMCAFDGSETGTHDDQVDGTTGAWNLICRPPIFKTLSAPTLPAIGADGETPMVQKIAAVEILDYKAYILLAKWYPYSEILIVTDEFCLDDIDEIAKAIKPCTVRVGTPVLESDSFKSINQALIKKQCPVMTQADLDIQGAVYSANAMIIKSAIGVANSLKLHGELTGADSTEELQPYTICLLRMIQDIRSRKKEKVKEYKPFERQRELAKKAQARELIAAGATKDWV